MASKNVIVPSWSLCSGVKYSCSFPRNLKHFETSEMLNWGGRKLSALIFSSFFHLCLLLSKRQQRACAITFVFGRKTHSWLDEVLFLLSIHNFRSCLKFSVSLFLYRSIFCISFSLLFLSPSHRSPFLPFPVFLVIRGLYAWEGKVFCQISGSLTFFESRTN